MELFTKRFEFIVNWCKSAPIKIPLVSVGCGAAFVERKLARMGLAQEVILVDPNPASFMPVGMKREELPKMDFPTTRALLSAQPRLRGNCCLFLWNPDPDFEYYDIEAIRLLAPQLVIIAYEANLTAGGYLLNAWLQTKFETQLPGTALSKDCIEKPYLWFPEESYRLLSMQEICNTDKHGECINRVVVLKMSPDSSISNPKEQFDLSFKIYQEAYKEELAAQRIQSTMLNLILSLKHSSN